VDKIMLFTSESLVFSVWTLKRISTSFDSDALYIFKPCLVSVARSPLCLSQQLRHYWCG